MPTLLESRSAGRLGRAGSAAGGMEGLVKGGRDLRWYAKRVRVMRPSEIMYRVGAQWRMTVLQTAHRMGWGLSRTGRNAGVHDPHRFSFCTARGPQLPELPWAFDPDEEFCAALLAGRVDSSGSGWVWRPDGLVWHEAPDTGRQWPRAFLGAIPYRPGNPFGDARLVWEPARLQQLVALGLLARQADPAVRARAVSLMDAQLSGWLAANPPLTGIHYVSAMECALRMLAACYALDLVRSWLPQPDRLWRVLLHLVHSHATLVAKRVSAHSSRGNHTIAEAAGLVHAGLLFPELDEAAEWLGYGLTLLEEEASRQVLPDGGGVEQSLHYQWFVADLLGLVVALLAHRRQPIPFALRAAYDRVKGFLSEFGETARALPQIGDGDDGQALSQFLRLPSPRHARVFGLRRFESAGYSIIRGREDRGTALVFDHGPLGMPPCYGHGHADALSVLFRMGHEDILVDPGTYTYGGASEWRSYFRSTAAHNTVTVDGLDQAVQEGPFLWSHPYSARLVRWDSAGDGAVRLLACHDGYVARLGVEHWRGLSYEPPGTWVIWDSLRGTGTHDLELHWHLGVEPARVARGFLLRPAGLALRLSVQGGDVSLHRGQTAPVLGWRAPAYGRIEPVTTLRVASKTRLPHEFVTRLWLADGPEPLEAGASAIAQFRRWIDEAQTGRNSRRTG